MLWRLFFVVCFLIFPCHYGISQPQVPVAHTLFLIGDAGEPLIVNSPIGAVLREKVSAASPHVTVLYLGDNIYPAGLPDVNSTYYNTASTILRAQINWIKGLDAHGIFIPGNHDWAHWGKEGFDHIRHQQQWLDSLHDDHIALLPRDGCPGPVEVPLTDHAVLVILDTQWFLHRWNKPGKGGVCDAKTTTEALANLLDIFHRNQGRRIIVAGHHPIITYGEHGGVFTLKQHLFPLTEIIPALYLPMPLIGSLYPLYRKWFGSIQDTTHPIYEAFAKELESLLKQYPGSMHLAGHEHALQYTISDSVHFIVSGSAAKTEHVRKKRHARFARDVKGFAQIAIHSDGSVISTFFQVDKKFPAGKNIYEKQIAGNDRTSGTTVGEKPDPTAPKPKRRRFSSHRN